MYLRQLFKHWTLQVFTPGRLLRRKYKSFKELLRHDKKSLELISDLEELLYGRVQADWAQVEALVQALGWSIGCLIQSLVAMHPGAYRPLEEHFHQFESSLSQAVSLPAEDTGPPYTITLAEAAQAPGLAGGKAHTLGRVLGETELPVPRGFVVTTNACHLFLQHNHLRHRLDELLAKVRLGDCDRLEGLARQMAALVSQADIPPVIAAEITQRLQDYQRQGMRGPWALRSSAVCEDGETCFAGQYASVLNVSDSAVFEAYKEVLASKYSPRAVAYRIRCGLADQENPMAALCLEMVDAAVSGVVYTLEQKCPGAADTCMAVYAIPGLGEQLVSGRAGPEVHYLSREEQPRPLGSLASSYRSEETGGKGPYLSEETAVLLAGWGMMLEKILQQPQDMEWCQDKQGALFLLQSRPLKTEVVSADKFLEASALPEVDNPVLLEGGVTASHGIGMGRVYQVRGEEELVKVSENAVLVSPSLSPAFATIIERLRAVVSQGGSRASHFASVAREYGLPVIVGAPRATKLLSPGQLVTVDANHCRVYQGEVESFKGRLYQPAVGRENPFFKRLRALMQLVSPLHLTDPASADFAPQGCRSLHDFVRFVHEKATAEMFSLVGRSGRGLARARRLQSNLPLVMYVLDLEDGIAPEAGASKTVDPRFITCKAMQAFWEGLNHPDVVWQDGLRYMDWEEFDRLSAGIITARSRALASYVILSRNYLHLMLRLGYHFAILDAFCADDPETNYVAFRFKGGGGNFENRMLRLQYIKIILEWAGFAVQSRGDLLDARYERQEAGLILSRLTLLGLLQGKTCLLDISLTSPDQVISLGELFKKQYQHYVVQEPPGK
jgi:pyruvate,water dikinase